MSDIEKMETEAAEPTVEELLAEVEDLQKQNDLLMQQALQMETRLCAEKEQWRQYRRDALAENDILRENILRLEQKAEKYKLAEAQERSRLVATVPKLVITSAVALALLMVPCTLQKLSIIGPQLSFGIECGLMMAISWCYALIWDRTRK